MPTQTHDFESLTTMTVDQLRVRYEELWFDKPRSRNRTWLIRKIAWRLQSLELGGLTDRARQRATTLARTAEVRTTLPRHITLVPREKPAKLAKTSKRDPRLPCVGASVVREYQGRRIEVRVLEDGLEYDGQRFRSLTAVAKAITGTHVNGFRFFHLESE